MKPPHLIPRSVLLACVLAGAMVLPAHALIMVGTGNAPVNDPGWPDGALAVANLKTRTGWWEGPPFGGGEWHFSYHGDSKALTEVVQAFTAIRAPALEVVLRDGPGHDTFIAGSLDWTFQVWVPGNWHRLYSNPRPSAFMNDMPGRHQPVPAPRLEVYLGGTNGLDWSAVKLPSGIRLLDERASAHAPGTGRVRVDVYDMATGKTIGGARVVLAPEGQGQPGSAAWSETRSDAQGRAEISAITPGRLTLSVLADGYAPRQVAREQFTTNSTRELVVELCSATNLAGRVTDAQGKPVANAKVELENLLGIDGRGYVVPQAAWAETNSAGKVVLRRSTQTDALGRYELSGLPCGYAFLMASAPGCNFGDYFTLFDTPSTNASLRLDRGGMVQVKVTDRAGHAIAKWEGHDLLVEMEPKGGDTVGSWGGSATVQADGTYQFGPVPAGDYRLRSHPNPSTSNKTYTPEQMVTVRSGQTNEIVFVYE